MKSVFSKTPKFYILPQIQNENKPGRPVINSINCDTAEIPHFVDHHQQPLVREIPSCIKDKKISSTKLIIFLLHLTHCLLKWMSSHNTQVFLIIEGSLQ